MSDEMKVERPVIGYDHYSDESLQHLMQCVPYDLRTLAGDLYAVRTELAAERERSAEQHERFRWTIEEDGDHGDLLICKRLHEKHESCQFVRYVRANVAEVALAAEKGKVERLLASEQMFMRWKDQQKERAEAAETKLSAQAGEIERITRIAQMLRTEHDFQKARADEMEGRIANALL